METVCRCLGLGQTDDCPYKACYKRLKPFSHVAAQLKSHYLRAVRVKSNRRNTKLRLWDAKDSSFTSQDLVYNERTADLCDSHLHLGISGIHGRECSTNRNQTNFCATFCCGYGYNTYVEEEEYPCNCRLQWLPQLHLECDRCRREHTLYLCK